MSVLKHFFVSLFLILTLYSVGMLVFKKITYKDKPLMFVTNNYFNWKGGDTYEKYKEFNEKQKYDLIFLGSSRAYRGYSPIIFETEHYTSFNLGTSAQSIKNTYFVLKNYVSNQNCKVLVLDIFSGSFLKDQLESTSDLIENLSKFEAAYEVAINSRDVRILNLLSLRLLTENDSAYFRKSDYMGRGYSANSDSLSKEKQAYVFSKKPITHVWNQIDPEQLDYFFKIIEWCKKKSINIVCVYSPASYFYDISQHKEFVTMIKPFMDKNKVPFLDYSNLNSIHKAYHFYDDSHLNSAGVRIFNLALINDLKKQEIIEIKCPQLKRKT